MERHLENHDEEGDWICGCNFQTNEYFLLKRHLRQFKTHQMQLEMRSELPKNTSKPNQEIKEAPKTIQSEETYQCTPCDLFFKTRNDLNKHMAEKHKSWKPCRKFQTNNCEFDSDCMFNHIKLGENEQICFKCGRIFKSKHEMMKHVQEVHPTPCYRHRVGQCTFGNKCIFIHEEVNHDQDFQMSGLTPAPPEWPKLMPKNQDQKKYQEKNLILNQMMTMMTQMSQMMAKICHIQQ